MDRARELVEVLTGVLESCSEGVELTAALRDLGVAACTLLPIDAAAVTLVDDERRLRPVMATDEVALRISMLQQALGEGPSISALDEDAPVLVDDLSRHAGRWPSFTSAALLAGMRTAAGLPVRIGSATVGSLDLFGRAPRPFTAEDLEVAEVLARAAAAHVADHRRRMRSEQVVDQLQYALTSRVTIEQAKGMLAVRLGTSVDAAFELLREEARRRNQRVADLAGQVIAGADQDLGAR